MVLEGRRIASGASRERKVRTPKGAMPRNPGLCGRDTRGRKVKRPFDGQCHRKLNRRSLFDAARVKRWCKRPPRPARAGRHGKPHRVQGQIGNPGAARSRFRESETDSGYRLHRQMVLSPGEIRGRQNSAYSPSKTIFLLRMRTENRGSHPWFLKTPLSSQTLLINGSWSF